MEITNIGQLSVKQLEERMVSLGYVQDFPDEDVASMDFAIFGNTKCLRCKSDTILLPYHSDGEYILYIVCEKCGEVRRA